MWDLLPEQRREADQKRLEEIRALPPDQQLAVKIDLRELAEAGYREDELLWAYELPSGFYSSYFKTSF